ncbi:cupin domain-containing protein [Thioalkalivibrio paradoxus]|uniref:Cupin n=1 Tax=Thioalkalivibrio paradoxus ARh 1 TaxID=713585 RepID=W0DHV6_9GAMM|nr:cupin domain-containing protein [Thioalkalivibrio paradoxus]AHE98179.1 cupin [Thioalkalivibrio paradoxus ARh 1]
MRVVTSNEHEFHPMGSSSDLEVCMVREAHDGGISGFIKIRKGATLPRHRHIAAEETYMIQGRMDLGDGRIAQAGDYLLMEPDEVHEMVAIEDSLFFVTAHRGVEWL